MFSYNVENEFASFRRTAEKLKVTANAQAGAFVTVIPPAERSRRRSRKVEVRISTASFVMDVPYDLGRELRTAIDGEPDLVQNLAKCFERAYMATISKDLFVTLRFDEACGNYENHQSSMRSEGYETVAHELMHGLGEGNYQSLLDALRRDLGFEKPTADEARPVRREESSVKHLSTVGQALPLFST